MTNPSIRRITIHEFADEVGCHYTTASRIRSGDRMPGRDLFYRILQRYNLDREEALTAYTGTRAEFGRYMREKVFHVTDEDVLNDRRRPNSQVGLS